jgi:TetR/AcrR family transcriptional regulator, cholesterol catabolism regulator
MSFANALDNDEGPRSKRAAILTAAVACFGEFGYEATKWATVADRVGIGQTALYHYFESKADCLLNIMRMELERSHQQFRAVTGLEASSEAALRAGVRAAYDVSEREVLQMRVLQYNMALLSTTRRSDREESQRTAARELVHQIEVAWTALINRGMEDGTFPRRDPHLLALSALGMMVSVWRWYRPSGSITLKEVSDSIEESIVRMVMN